MPSKVMIIDDSVLVLSIIRFQLEEAGFEVITRESALGTAAAVLREQPDVILVDVMMPALGGENLVSLLRKQPGNREMQILLFSDKPPEVLQALAIQAGADGFVTKGTHPDLLVAQVHACIKSRAAAAAAAAAAAVSTPSPSSAALPLVEPFVLFVDRDSRLRPLCTLMVPLGAAGFIQSGQEALHILQSNHPPTCIFVGTQLADMRGEELWRAAVAIDGLWREKMVLMSDPEQPMPAPASSGPRWTLRPTEPGDIGAIAATMRRP